MWTISSPELIHIRTVPFDLHLPISSPPQPLATAFSSVSMKLAVFSKIPHISDISYTYGMFSVWLISLSFPPFP